LVVVLGSKEKGTIGIRGGFVRDTCGKYTRGFFESAGGAARVDERLMLG
jgi:hypothetical protein